MNESLRAFVRERAQHRCEYCHLPEARAAFTPFHIEHITAKKHGGADAASNRALSCHHCNFAKSSNLSGIDPVSKKITRLFHPRRHKWSYHFPPPHRPHSHRPRYDCCFEHERSGPY